MAGNYLKLFQTISLKFDKQRRTVLNGFALFISPGYKYSGTVLDGSALFVNK